MVKWSAVGLIVMSVVHMLVLGTMALPSVPHWLAGGLWTMAHGMDYAAQPQDVLVSSTAFWASVPSFALPCMIFGALIVHMVRRGQFVPPFVGWGLLAWSLACSLIIEPSGFPAGIIISLVMLAGIYRQPRRLEAAKGDVAGAGVNFS